MEEQELTGPQETAEKKSSVWKSAMTYGLYYAIFSIVLSVIIYAAGLMMSKPVSYVTMAIMIVVVVLIQLHYRKSLGGYITYGQSLAISVLSMLCTAIPIAIFTYILYKYIDPGLLEQIKMATEEKMLAKGNLSQEQVDAAMTITSKFQTPVTIAFGQIVSLPLMGLIIGLITSIFIKKASPDKIFE
jgi:cobalamin synthase